MAYEAVPDDVEIQKLTALERDALSRHKTHENINTFLGNQNTPLLIGGAALLALTPILFDLIRNALAEAGTKIPDVNWEAAKKGAIYGAGGAFIIKKLQNLGDGELDLGLEQLFKRYKNDKP